LNLTLRRIYYNCLSILLLFSFFQAINGLSINYFETVHRLSSYTTMSTALFSDQIDRSITILLMVTSAILLFIMTRNKREDSPKKFLPTSLTVLAICTLYFLNEALVPLFLIILSNLLYMRTNSLTRDYFNSALTFMTFLFSLSLVRWLTYPFLKTDFYSDLTWIPSKIEKTVFYFFNVTLSPYLITALMLSWLVAPLASKIKAIGIERGGLRLSLSAEIHEEDLKTLVDRSSSDGRLTHLLDRKIAFIVSFLSLIYLSYYSYLPSLNPSGKPTSVDIMYNYVPTLKRFESLGLTEIGIKYLFSAGALVRPVVVLPIFFSSKLLGVTYVDALKFSFFVAGFLLVISTYLSLRIMTGNELLATMSIYLTTFSIQTAVGLYAGYLGMWISASFELLAISFLAKAVGDQDMRKLVPAILFSVLALLSHLWTWFIFTLAVVMILPTNFILNRLRLKRGFSKRQKIILVVFILSPLLGDLLRQLFFSSPSTLSMIYSAFRWGSGSVQNLFLYDRNIYSMLHIYVGGFTNNYLIYTFSIIGAVLVLKHNGLLPGFVYSALLVCSPAFFLCDHRPQSRILYFLPLPIMATLGLFNILRTLKGNADVVRFFQLVMLLLSNYAFRSVANLV